MYDPSDLRVFDPFLTNFAVGYRDQQLFGEQLFPVTRVGVGSGRYRVFNRADWLRYRAHRAPGTVANEVSGRKWSEDTFHVEEFSLQSPVYDEEREELAAMGSISAQTFGGPIEINPERDAVKLITRSLLLDHEKTVADTIRNAANYAAGNKVTLTASGTGTRWDNYALATAGNPLTAYSDPVSDLRTAARAVYKGTGMQHWPNTIVIPEDAVGVIENHPRVVARYQYTSVYSQDAWRMILGIPEDAASAINVLVVSSKINSADNIDDTENIVSLWGQDIWVGYVDPADSLDAQTFGKTFARPYPNGDIRPVDRWREEPRKTDIFRVSYRWDLKVVNANAGYLITTAVNLVF